MSRKEEKAKLVTTPEASRIPTEMPTWEPPTHRDPTPFLGFRDRGKQASKGHARPEAAQRLVPLCSRCWQQRGAGQAGRATLTELLQLRGHGLGAQGEGRGWSTLGRRGSFRGRLERQRCENLARMSPTPPPCFQHDLGASGPEPAGKADRQASPRGGGAAAVTHWGSTQAAMDRDHLTLPE